MIAYTTRECRRRTPSRSGHHLLRSLGLIIPWLLGCGEVVLDTTEERNAASPYPKPAFYVDGTELRDPCGSPVLLRGVNEQIIYSDGRDGKPEFAAIAQTGANAVRITWSSSGTAAELDKVIEVAVAEGLLPLIDLHDGQGDWSAFDRLLAYWLTPEILEVVKKHESHLLVGFGGGLGGNDVPADAWTSAYVDALQQLRAAGIRTPIVVDAPGWGQEIDRLQESGPSLLEADPLHSLLFGVAIWWPGDASARITAELDESAQLGLPLLIAEFSGHGIACTDTIAYDTILADAQAHHFGWFAWSWGAISNAKCTALDMTKDGTVAGLTEWGLDVALTNPNGISRTSNRSRWLQSSSCDTPPAR